MATIAGSAMPDRDVLQHIEANRLIAVLREPDLAEIIDQLAETLIASGVRTLEITLTSGGAFDALRRAATLAAGLGGEQITVGAGSVRTRREAELAIDAGAEFVVSPGLVPDLLLPNLPLDALVIPGAFTPSEIMAAHAAGAAAIKVFPISALPKDYLKSVLAPLPDVKLAPTGGVGLDDIGDLLRMGAIAVGLGSSLAPRDLIADRNWGAIGKRAAEAVRKVRDAR